MKNDILADDSVSDLRVRKSVHFAVGAFSLLCIYLHLSDVI